MNKMHGLLEKILEQNARNERERIFHYSNYWKNWSRILYRGGRGRFNALEIIELNLTPMPNCFSSSWEKDVEPIVFRCHGTMPDAKDLFERKLPEKIVMQMRDHLGYQLALRLLTEDWMSLIDLEKLRTYPQQGGKPLVDIKREQYVSAS